MSNRLATTSPAGNIRSNEQKQKESSRWHMVLLQVTKERQTILQSLGGDGKHAWFFSSTDYAQGEEWYKYYLTCLRK